MPPSRRMAVIFATLLVCLTGAVSAVADTMPTNPLNPSGFTLLDAVYTTLWHDPNIQLARYGVQSSAGALQAARGAFDLTIDGSAAADLTRTPNLEATRLSTGVPAAATATTSVTGGVTQPFRDGSSASLAASLTRSEDLSRYASTPPASRSTITFTWQLPLLRGRGAEVAALGERTAALEYEASEATCRHTISEQVNTTVQRYWALVVARERLAARQHSEQSALDIAEKTRRLIAAGETPRAELDQVLATCEQNRAARFSAENNLHAAQQALVMAMGLDPRSDTLPPPLSPLDSFTAQSIGTLAPVERYLAVALRRRQDYRAAVQRVAAAQAAYVAAQRDLLPDLDLSLAAGYSGLDEGSAPDEFLRGFANSIHGANVAATLAYAWPVGNNAARGTLLLREAAWRQQALNADNLARGIRSSIITLTGSIQRLLATLASSDAAYRAYATAVENEKKKYLLGNSTLLNIISYEDRLTGARLSVLDVQQELARSVAQLRHETGTLVATGGSEARVAATALTMLPDAD